MNMKSIEKNNDYNRKNLISNAEQIIKNNFKNKLLENNTLLFYNESKNNIPYQFNNIYDTSTPKGYSDSLLKTFYQIKQQLENILV